MVYQSSTLTKIRTRTKVSRYVYPGYRITGKEALTMTLDEWLDIRNARGVVDFVEPRENLQVIWDAATSVERDRCKEKCEELSHGVRA